MSWFAGPLSLLMLAGCAVGPDYKRPEAKVSDKWREQIIAGLTSDESTLHTWWRTLNDPVLTSLIERAGKNNYNLQVALARVRAARALSRVALGHKFPDVNYAGAGGFTRYSEAMAPDLPRGLHRDDNFFLHDIDATWEIDFWGRVRRMVESSTADYEASIEDYRDALVVLFGDVAATYVEIRTLQLRIKFNEQNIDLQRRTLELVRNRLKAELVPVLDVRQAEQNLAATEARLPVLRSALKQAINRLAVLLGEPPGALHEEVSRPAPIPRPPEKVFVGLPRDLLRQRPDIRSAERRLAARTAEIGVATADLYPRFMLNGAFGYETNHFEDIFDNGNIVYSFGPSFFWNIFDGGRVRGRIDHSKARAAEALAAYKQTVLLALEDVENAMVAYNEEQKRREALRRSAEASEAAVKLVQTLYKTGLTDFQNVLDMERTLASVQDELAQSDGAVVTHLIRVYRSLGGGWRGEAPKTNAQRKTQAKAKK